MSQVSNLRIFTSQIYKSDVYLQFSCFVIQLFWKQMWLSLFFIFYFHIHGFQSGRKSAEMADDAARAWITLQARSQLQPMMSKLEPARGPFLIPIRINNLDGRHINWTRIWKKKPENNTSHICFQNSCSWSEKIWRISTKLSSRVFTLDELSINSAAIYLDIPKIPKGSVIEWIVRVSGSILRASN